MKIIQPFDPSVGTSGTIKVGLVNRCSGFVLYNESSIGLTLTFRDGSTATLPPWWARSYRVQIAPVPTVDWKFSYSLNSSGSPQSLVLGEAYDGNEVVPDVNAPLSRLQNIGNNVSANVAGATSLQNDGSAIGTSLIEATVAGGASSNISVSVDGAVHIKVLDGGVLTEKLTIIPGVSGGAASVLIHGTADNVPATGVTAGALPAGVTIGGGQVSSAVANATNATNATSLNNEFTAVDDSANTLARLVTPSNRGFALRVNDGTSNHDITILDKFANVQFVGTQSNIWQVNNKTVIDDSVNANDVFIKAQSTSGGVHFQTSSGTGIGYFDSGGSLHLEGTVNSIYLQDASKFSRYHGFTGTGSGTFNHLCGVIPTAISLTTNVVGSQTMGYDTVTSTQCHVTTGASLGWYGESILL